MKLLIKVTLMTIFQPFPVKFEPYLVKLQGQLSPVTCYVLSFP